MKTKIIHDMAFTFDPFDGKTFFVHVEIAGAYSHSEEFLTCRDALAFFADPLAKDRKASNLKARSLGEDTRFLDRHSRMYPRTAY